MTERLTRSLLALDREPPTAHQLHWLKPYGLEPLTRLEAAAMLTEFQEHRRA